MTVFGIHSLLPFKDTAREQAGGSADCHALIECRPLHGFHGYGLGAIWDELHLLTFSGRLPSSQRFQVFAFSGVDRS